MLANPRRPMDRSRFWREHNGGIKARQSCVFGVYFFERPVAWVAKKIVGLLQTVEAAWTMRTPKGALHLVPDLHYN